MILWSTILNTAYNTNIKTSFKNITLILQLYYYGKHSAHFIDINTGTTLGSQLIRCTSNKASDLYRRDAIRRRRRLHSTRVFCLTRYLMRGFHDNIGNWRILVLLFYQSCTCSLFIVNYRYVEYFIVCQKMFFRVCIIFLPNFFIHIEI